MGLKESLKEKENLFGVFCKTNDPLVIGALGKSGADFIILDNEHGPNSVRETYNLVLAAKEAKTHPVVRVGKLEDIEIQRILDLGVGGIQIPQIQNKEDAKKVIEFTKFNSKKYPSGKRGVCKYVSAADFSLKEKEKYFLEQNETVANIIHIEGIEGIKNIDSILEIEGIDVVFIGPYDLSASLGMPGDIKNPFVLEKIEEVIKKCQERGKYLGIFVDDVEMGEKYAKMGIKYIAYSTDVGILSQGMKKFINKIKNKNLE